MIIIDLTHFISSKMPVYPNTDSPKISDTNTIEKNGFAEKIISMSTHTGTHVDSPAHMIKGSNTLDKFNINQFMGAGKVINISRIKKNIIEMDDIASDIEKIMGIDFVLFIRDGLISGGKISISGIILYYRKSWLNSCQNLN